MSPQQLKARADPLKTSKTLPLIYKENRKFWRDQFAPSWIEFKQPKIAAVLIERASSESSALF
jgi:hypothetical protein